MAGKTNKKWKNPGWLIISKSLLRYDRRLGLREGVREEGSEGGIEVSEGGVGDGINVVMDDISVMMGVMNAPCLVNNYDVLLCNV